MSNGTVDLILYHIILNNDVTAPVHTLCVLYDEYRTGGAFDPPTQNTINMYIALLSCVFGKYLEMYMQSLGFDCVIYTCR